MLLRAGAPAGPRNCTRSAVGNAVAYGSSVSCSDGAGSSRRQPLPSCGLKPFRHLIPPPVVRRGKQPGLRERGRSFRAHIGVRAGLDGTLAEDEGRAQVQGQGWGHGQGKNNVAAWMVCANARRHSAFASALSATVNLEWSCLRMVAKLFLQEGIAGLPSIVTESHAASAMQLSIHDASMRFEADLVRQTPHTLHPQSELTCLMKSTSSCCQT